MKVLLSDVPHVFIDDGDADRGTSRRFNHPKRFELCVFVLKKSNQEIQKDTQ